MRQRSLNPFWNNAYENVWILQLLLGDCQLRAFIPKYVAKMSHETELQARYFCIAEYVPEDWYLCVIVFT